MFPRINCKGHIIDIARTPAVEPTYVLTYGAGKSKTVIAEFTSETAMLKFKDTLSNLPLTVIEADNSGYPVVPYENRSSDGR